MRKFHPKNVSHIFWARGTTHVNTLKSKHILHSLTEFSASCGSCTKWSLQEMPERKQINVINICYNSLMLSTSALKTKYSTSPAVSIRNSIFFFHFPNEKQKKKRQNLTWQEPWHRPAASQGSQHCGRGWQGPAGVGSSPGAAAGRTRGAADRNGARCKGQGQGHLRARCTHCTHALISIRHRVSTAKHTALTAPMHFSASDTDSALQRLLLQPHVGPALSNCCCCFGGMHLSPTHQSRTKHWSCF